MKRNPVIVVAGLVAAMSLALAGCASTPAAAPASTPGGGATQAPAGKAYKVGISQYVAHPSLDASREGFKKALADAGLDVTYDEKNGNADQATVTSISTTFAAAKLDLVLAIATPSAQAAAQAITDTPVLFTAVTDPVAAKLVDSMAAPGANVTGTSDMNPVAEQIALVKKLKPEAKTLGIIYSSGEVNSEVQVKAAEEAAKDLDIEIVTKTVTTANDIANATEALGDVDAIYVPTDNMVVAGISSLIQVAETKQIPVIGAESGTVEGGAIATLGIDYETLGKQTGEMAIKIIEGADPATTPVEFASEFTYVVNPAAAERMGVSFEDFLVGAAGQIPVGRTGKSEDIAHAASFFASEGAGFVSGQVLYVAGGPTA